MTQDMPNTVTDAQMRLRQDMHGSIEWQVRASTDPQWLRRQLSPTGPDTIVPPSKTAKRVAILVVAMVIGGIVLGMCSAGRAAEPPRTWQVWDETANKPWLSKKGEPATATGPTACSLSLWEVAKATQDGTRLSCRRIDQRN